MNVLTPDELAFLAKIEKQRKKHAEAQALYRTKHQEELKDYNKKKYEDQRTKLNEINKKIVQSTPINIQHRTTILSNITKLKRIDDILLYALYTLFPARRCDWRNVKLTVETDTEN